MHMTGVTLSTVGGTHACVPYNTLTMDQQYGAPTERRDKVETQGESGCSLTTASGMCAGAGEAVCRDTNSLWTARLHLPTETLDAHGVLVHEGVWPGLASNDTDAESFPPSILSLLWGSFLSDLAIGEAFQTLSSGIWDLSSLCLSSLKLGNFGAGVCGSCS